MEIVYIIEKF